MEGWEEDGMDQTQNGSSKAPLGASIKTLFVGMNPSRFNHVCFIYLKDNSIRSSQAEFKGWVKTAWGHDTTLTHTNIRQYYIKRYRWEDLLGGWLTGPRVHQCAWSRLNCWAAKDLREARGCKCVFMCRSVVHVQRCNLHRDAQTKTLINGPREKEVNPCQRCLVWRLCETDLE